MNNTEKKIMSLREIFYQKKKMTWQSFKFKLNTKIPPHSSFGMTSRLLNFFFFFLFLISCKPEFKGSPDRFKEGVFEIPAGEGYSKTTIIRKDSLHIESYEKITEVTTEEGLKIEREPRTDTLYITWKNNFFYTLRMKSPKTELDKDKIFVQITGVKDSSYTFSAKIGYSDFVQEGTVYKIK